MAPEFEKSRKSCGYAVAGGEYCRKIVIDAGRTVRLNGLGTFTMKARTRGKGTVKAEDVNPNQVTALRCQFTPEYTRPAAIGTTRALLQGVEFEKWLEAAVEGGTSGGGESDGGEEEDPLG